MVRAQGLTGDLAAAAAARMGELSPGVDAEVHLISGRSRRLSRRDGRRDGLESSETLGVGVRAVRDGRVGFACGPAGSFEELLSLWPLALAQLRCAEPEAAAALAAGAALPPPEPALAASLDDAALLERSWEDLESLLGEAEAEAASAGALIVRSELSVQRARAVTASTRGVLADETGSWVDASISAAESDGGRTQVGEGWRGARALSALDARAAGREARARAEAGIDGRRTRGGRRAVVFEPWVGAEILEILAEMLSAEEAQRGRSLLADRLGRRVASALVALRDDPRRLGAYASSLFDDEGVPTQDKALVEAGVLRGFLHDAATASRAGAASNGCGYRGSWSDLPSPGASNFHLAPGPLSREALLSGTRDGVLVLELLGAHMIDPVSGEFSLGVSGRELDGGRLGRAFGGAMISGNLLDMLARVDAVADDLAFYGVCGAPTFRVDGLDLA